MHAVLLMIMEAEAELGRPSSSTPDKGKVPYILIVVPRRQRHQNSRCFIALKQINTAVEIALRLVRPRNKNYELTQTIQKVANGINCYCNHSSSGRYSQVIANVIGSKDCSDLLFQSKSSVFCEKFLKCSVYQTETRLPSLFKKYMQAGADTACKYGGTGLGLAICKQLASRGDQAYTSDCCPITKKTLILEGNIVDDVPIEDIRSVWAVAGLAVAAIFT
ncbi:histidine kinase 5 [Tanacetum coccineum]